MARLSVVGIGPGDWRELTLRAAEALEAAEVIVGYTLYVDLVRPHLPGKDFRATGMRGEAERCRLALELARGVAQAIEEMGIYLQVYPGEGFSEFLGDVVAKESDMPKLSAQFQIQFPAEFPDYFKDPFGLHLRVFFVIKPNHTRFS